MKKLHTFILLSILIYTTIFSFYSKPLSSEEASELLQKLDKKVSQIKSYTADVERKSYKNVFDREGLLKTEGKVYYKNPNKIRQDHNVSGILGADDFFIINGNKKWIYDPYLNTVFSENAKQLNYGDKNTNLAIFQYNVASLVYEGITNEEGVILHIFTSTVSSNSSEDEDVYFVKIYFSDQDGLVRKIEEYDKNGNILAEEIFKNYKKNIRLDDSLFVFTPPKGAQVINFD